MKTTFRAKQPYADVFLQCADEFVCNSPVKPERFIIKMQQNQGAVSSLTGLDQDGLERKNPVIAALGDSVTAGHFESIFMPTPELLAKISALMKNPTHEAIAEIGSVFVEITDARESYIEKFRYKLIDLFEKTSVSVINAGIAGDTLVSMAMRADRDVIRYQPDLVLINGSLNWTTELGSSGDYKRILRDLVHRIKNETDADIVLLTPNGEVREANPLFESLGIQMEPSSLPERVKAIRDLAVEEKVCLADVYAVWEAVKEKGCPWKELLANGSNHPGAEGHEVYAKVLMKLFE